MLIKKKGKKLMNALRLIYEILLEMFYEKRKNN